MFLFDRDSHLRSSQQISRAVCLSYCLEREIMGSIAMLTIKKNLDETQKRCLLYTFVI